MQDNFHIVLPSNAQSGNTAAEFLTNFQTPFRIDNADQWEVGLKEINFANTIKTIDTDYARVDLVRTITKATRKNQTLNESAVGYYTFDNDDTNRDYLNPKKSLIQFRRMIRLSDLETLATENFKFYYDEATGYIHFQNLSKFTITVSFPERDILNQFGFPTNYSINTFKLSTGHSTQGDRKPKIITLDGTRYILLKTVYMQKVDIDATAVKKLIKFKLSDLEMQPDSADVSGLKTIQYRMCSHTMKKTYKNFTYNISFRSYTKVKTVATLQLKSGTYVDSKDLEVELNKDASFNKYFKFSYDPRLNRFDITTVTKNKTAKLYLQNGLADVIGFSKSIIDYSKEIQKGQMEVNLLRGINSLFVYCDAVAPIRVGTIMAPLLRTVSFNVRKYGEIIHVNYTNPIYLDLNKSYFDVLSIKICDVVGTLIPFEEGITTVILHFKRKE